MDETVKSYHLIWRQMVILLWRSYVTKKRHYIITFFEVFLPVAVISLFLWSSTGFNEHTKGLSSDGLKDREKRDNHSNIVKRELFGRLPVIDWDLRGLSQLSPLYYEENIDAIHLIVATREFLRKNYPSIQLLPSNSKQATSISFQDVTGLFKKDGSFKYTISGVTRRSKFPKPWIEEGQYFRSHDYESWLPIQYLLNQVYVSIRTSKWNNSLSTLDLSDIKCEPISTDLPLETEGPTSREDKVRKLVLKSIAACFILSLIVPFCTLCSRLITEKYSGVKEMLIMTGLGHIVYWISTFICYFIYIWFSVFLVSFALIIIGPHYVSPLKFALKGTEFSCLTFILFVHTVLLVLSGILLTIPFNRPRFGIISAIAIYALPLPLKLYATTINNPLLYLLPNFGLLDISNTIAQNNGLNWSHFGHLGGLKSIDTGGILLFMVISCFLQAFLIWYLDLVWPFQPGVPRSFFFLCSPSYWWPKEPGQLEPIKRPTSQYFEEEPSSDIAIAVRGVTKKFSGGLSGVSHLAVNNVDLNVYHGSITCLLGHNGAGKTTTMNMITGMFMPSKGRIQVNGYDLFTQTRQARSKMSLCPQHNPLCDDFTVKEHLYLYAGLRGVAWSQLENEAQETMRSLALVEHENKLPNQLSGGMKRKLCLAMALVGNCEIVILDEPSAGLDTEARRRMWDCLKEIRHSRTILMTTHDMEEADALADRIVIMHSGTIICSGSSMFLKKTLCTGYVLKICKQPSFDGSGIMALLRNYLSRAEVKNDIGSEITYNLNESIHERANLAECFNVLESNMSQLGIESFGVAASSLEEVFLKIGQISDLTHEQNDRSENLLRPNIEELIASDVFRVRLTGFPLFVSQFHGLLMKRFNNLKRNWPLQVFCIIIAFALALIIDDEAFSPYHSDQMDISAQMYKGHHYSFRSNNSDILSSNFPSKLRETLKGYGLAFEAWNASNSRLFDLQIDQLSQSKQRVRYNHEATYSRQVVLNVLFETIANVDGSKSTIETTYKMHSLPYNATDTKGMNDEGDEIPIFLLVNITALIIFIAFACVTSCYISSPIQERIYKTKLLQLMTGLHPVVFFFANLVFDLAFHVAFSLTFFAFIFTYLPHLFSNFIFQALFTPFLFGMACIAFLYLASFIFATPARGFTYVIVFQILSTTVFWIVKTILDDVLHQNKLATLRNFVFNMSPFFSFMQTLGIIIHNGYRVNKFASCSGLTAKQKFDLCFIRTSQSIEAGDYNINDVCCPGTCIPVAGNSNRDLCSSRLDYSFVDPSVGYLWLIMLAQFFTYSLLLILIEMKLKKLTSFLCRPKLPMKKYYDEDVQREEQIVQSLIENSATNSRALVAASLYKNYSNFFAVKGISFTVNKNECFGLLGVNGAGKSTTFGILTGDLLATSGKVFQEDLEVTSRTREYQANIGYCPQYNALLETLTGREMLDLFGRLRGVPKDSLVVLTNEMIRLVNLEHHADKPSGTYSGGNKRKLSIALAMIGNPKLVLLDEPTAGVDPAARRLIWSTLQYIREQFDCSMVLTSHSMDECESLCSRLAIMVSGEFVCLGSAQHLKGRFGHGYTLSIKFRKEQTDDIDFFEAFNQTLNQTLVKVQLLDRHATIATYRVAKEVGSWSQVFYLIEDLALRFNLEDYTLSDTTLEQIFIQFAKSQKDAPDDVNEPTNESIQLLTKTNKVSA